jgi:hypothetical protein
VGTRRDKIIIGTMQRASVFAMNDANGQGSRSMLAWLLVLSSLLVQISGCASLPHDFERLPSRAEQATVDTPLGQMVLEAAQAHPGRSGFLLQDTGRSAFLQRAALIEAAERSITSGTAMSRAGTWHAACYWQPTAGFVYGCCSTISILADAIMFWRHSPATRG